jgi:hypothetical protein
LVWETLPRRSVPAGRTPMTKLQRVHAEHGQDPRHDNLTRGRLVSMVADSARGVIANPTIFVRARESQPRPNGPLR